MVIEIMNISILRATKVGALTGFLISSLVAVLFVAFALLPSYGRGVSVISEALISAIALPVMPLLGIAYGGVAGLVLAFCYNFVAARWGGMLITTREALRSPVQVAGAGARLAGEEN